MGRLMGWEIQYFAVIWNY